MALEAYYPYVAAVALFVAAGYFLHRLRATTDQFRSLSPIALYMIAVGLYFAFNGFSVFASSSCPGVDCTDLSSAIAVMLAGAFVARYPLREVWPTADLWVFLGLSWFAVVAAVLVAFIEPEMLLEMAYGFAAVVGGLFAGGYFLSQVVASLRSDDETAVNLASPNVAALGLVIVATMPLAGSVLDTAVLSPLLSPLPLLAVHLFFARVDLDVVPAVDAEAAP